jgi:hypothetical protein
VKREAPSKFPFSLLATSSFFVYLALLHPSWLASAQPAARTSDQQDARPISQEVKDISQASFRNSSQVLRVDVELALVNVVVTDPYNRLVTGLDTDNFRVFEDNVEQEITTFSSEDVPISIGVIFDLAKPGRQPSSSLRLPIQRMSFFWLASMNAPS